MGIGTISCAGGVSPLAAGEAPVILGEDGGLEAFRLLEEAPGGTIGEISCAAGEIPVIVGDDGGLEAF